MHLLTPLERNTLQMKLKVHGKDAILPRQIFEVETFFSLKFRKKKYKTNIF